MSHINTSRISRSVALLSMCFITRLLSEGGGGHLTQALKIAKSTLLSCASYHRVFQQNNQKSGPDTIFIARHQTSSSTKTMLKGTATPTADDNSTTDDNEQSRLIPSRFLGGSRPPTGPGPSPAALCPLSPHDRNIYVTPPLPAGARIYPPGWSILLEFSLQSRLPR